MIMGTKIKGIYNGIKRRFVKKREMEIGSPTDVKHVSHIGLGDSSTSGPSWMSQFKAYPEFTTSSNGDSSSAVVSPSTSSQVSSISRDQQSPTRKLTIEIPSTETTPIPTPKKRANKNKAISTSPTSTISTEISSTETCTVPKKREKRHKVVSSSSASRLSTEIPNTETPTAPKKRKKKTSGTSPSPRSSKHSKTKANLVEVE